MSNTRDDAATDLLIREVDDDLRQENLHKLWKKYGALMVGGAVAVVLSVAGVQGWQVYQRNQAQLASQRFAAAILQVDKGDKVKGADSLQALAAEGNSGYRLLAEMKMAQMKVESGDLAAAIALYEKVAGDSGIDGVYRDLASLKAAYLKLNVGQVDGLEARMTPLAVEASPWRHSAREVLALVALKAGDNAKAQDWLRKVTDDVAAPTAIRGRAAELLAALDNGAKG
ncbi:MAG: tetratricopeptide repeat protein [Magnetospirillum sp.]